MIRPLSILVSESEVCHIRTSERLTSGSAATSNWDHFRCLINALVGPGEDRGRDGKAERIARY